MCRRALSRGGRGVEADVLSIVPIAVSFFGQYASVTTPILIENKRSFGGMNLAKQHRPGGAFAALPMMKDYLHKEREVKKRLYASALVAVTASMGCVTLPVVATVVTQPGRRVTAEASKFNVFGLSPLPVETSSLLLDDLVEQCDGADLTGVTVGTETGFAFIGTTEKIIVTGYCVEPSG